MNRKEFLVFGGIAVASVFGITGLLKELASRAATPSLGAESEVGASTSPAIVVTDSTASGGKAIKFGSTAPTWPDLPQYPTVKWESLYVSGDSVKQTIDRMRTNGTIIELPNGFDGEIDASTLTSSYAIINLNCRGIIGPGPDKARMVVKRNSLAASVESFTTMRLQDGRPGPAEGNNSGAAGGQNIFAGWHLAGTDQHLVEKRQNYKKTYDSNGNLLTDPFELSPANYAGLVIYNGRNAIIQNMRFSGIPGNWNSPPGETFQLNDYKGNGNRYIGVEVNGINIDGKQRGGSPLGLNNSRNTYVQDLWAHDSFVSSLTGSFTSSSTTPGLETINWHTVGCRVYRNANHYPVYTPGGEYPKDVSIGGKRFTGINHENVIGKIIHDRPDIFISPMSNGVFPWDASHFAFASGTSNTDDIHIIEPTWNSLYTGFKGCLIIELKSTYLGAPPDMVNKQYSMPEVIKNGRALQPYFWSQGNGSVPANLPVSPDTHYIVFGTDRRR